MPKKFNPYLFSLDLVLSVTAFFFFATLDDPNSWTGLGWMVVTWLFVCSIVVQLKGEIDEQQGR